MTVPFILKAIDWHQQSSPAEVDEVAILDAGLLLNSRDMGWLLHPHIQSSRAMLPFLYKGMTKRNGGGPALGHLYGVGHEMANEPDLALHSSDDEAVFAHSALMAFIGIHHDSVETAHHRNAHVIDMQDVTREIDAAYIASFWPGTVEGQKLARISSRNMTDAPGLHGIVRINAQAEKTARQPKHDQYVRVYDKRDQVLHDIVFFAAILDDIREGLVPETQIQIYLTQANVAAETAAYKQRIVEAAHLVRPELKMEYSQFVERISDLASDFRAESRGLVGGIHRGGDILPRKDHG